MPTPEKTVSSTAPPGKQLEDTDAVRRLGRDEVMRLEPSEIVDLALLEDGSSPFETDPTSRTVLSDAGPVELRGDVDVLPTTAGTRLRASGNGEVEALGDRL